MCNKWITKLKDWTDKFRSFNLIYRKYKYFSNIHGILTGMYHIRHLINTLTVTYTKSKIGKIKIFIDHFLTNTHKQYKLWQTITLESHTRVRVVPALTFDQNARRKKWGNSFRYQTTWSISLWSLETRNIHEMFTGFISSEWGNGGAQARQWCQWTDNRHWSFRLLRNWNIQQVY